MPNLALLTPSSLQILDKTQTGLFPISRFLIKLLKTNSSRTINDIDMKLGPLKWQEEHGNIKEIWRWPRASKLWHHCHFSNWWLIWSNPGTGFRTRDRSLIELFYLTKTENRTKKSNIPRVILPWVKKLFLPKNADFLQKIAEISKILWFFVLKVIFLETQYLCTKFQVSSIILTSFRQGVTSLLLPSQKESLKFPPRLVSLLKSFSLVKYFLAKYEA